MPGSVDSPVLRIAQITDTHLYADPENTLLGLKTRHCLQQVAELAARRKPHLVVASGDLAHDASPTAYRAVRDCLEPLAVPVYCLPGNHDEAMEMRKCMNDAPFRTISCLRTGGWQMLFLDSSVSGSEAGHLGTAELARLEGDLASAPDSPSIVWLHHQPVPVGSSWLDTMAIDNGNQLLDIVDRHPQVRGIVWGHVHQLFEKRHKDTLLLATPSTCIQFLPGSEAFAVDHIPPGYRWFELYGDGRLASGVERLPEIPGNIDTSARGY